MPTTPNPNSIPWQAIDASLAKQMLDVLEKLESIDRRLGLLEKCLVSEPGKAELKKALQEIADRI